LAVNYFKTEAQSKPEGSKWFEFQPMCVNKLNSLMKEMTVTEGVCENKSQPQINVSSKTPK